MAVNPSLDDAFVEKNGSSQRESWVLALGLLTLLTLQIVRSPVSESLWLDECISSWITQSDQATAFDRSYNFQGQSPFYFSLLKIWRDLCGDSAWALRSLSLLFSAIALYFLFGLSKGWFGSRVAWISLYAYVSYDGVIKASISARPYALAMALTLASVYWLFHWIRYNKYLSLLAYCICSTLAIYSHYLFLPILGLHTAFFACSPKGQRTVSCARFLVALSLVLILLVPAVPQLQLITTRAASYSLAKMPGLIDLIKAWFPGPNLVYLISALIVARIFGRLQYDRTIARPLKCWFFVWLLFPALWLFLYSHLSGKSLWVDRQYLWFAPALAIISGYLVSAINVASARRIAVLTFIGLIFLRELDRVWYSENWSWASQQVKQINAEHSQPIFLYSGLIELDDPAFLLNSKFYDYLSAPFQIYSIQKRAILLPSSFHSIEMRSYFSKQITAELEMASSFVLVCLKIRRYIDAQPSYLSCENLQSEFSTLGYEFTDLSEQRNMVKVLKAHKSKVRDS